MCRYSTGPGCASPSMTVAIPGFCGLSLGFRGIRWTTPSPSTGISHPTTTPLSRRAGSVTVACCWAVNIATSSPAMRDRSKGLFSPVMTAGPATTRMIARGAMKAKIVGTSTTAIAAISMRAQAITCATGQPATGAISTITAASSVTIRVIWRAWLSSTTAATCGILMPAPKATRSSTTRLRTAINPSIACPASPPMRAGTRPQVFIRSGAPITPTSGVM